MLLYRRYLTEAEKYYQRASEPAFLIDPVTLTKHQAGTLRYTISLIYLILKAYSEGIEKAFDKDESGFALNRSFTEDTTALMSFIQTKLIETTHLSLDICFSRILDQIDFVLLKNLNEKPRKPGGDFSHACAAIYLILGDCYRYYQLNTEEKTLFNASYSAVEDLYKKLGDITLDIFNNFFVPMRLLETSLDLNARFQFYLLLARKTKATSSPQALIAALETYIIRFKWVGFIPIPTLRTHRTEVTHLIAGLNNNSISLGEALNRIAKLTTTPDGEFQHLLVGLYSAFAEEGRAGFAIALANCKVQIGSAETMSIDDYYHKYVAHDHQPEVYKSFLRQLSLSDLEKSQTRDQQLKYCLDKIAVCLRTLPDSEISALTSGITPAGSTTTLSWILSALSPTRAAAKSPEQNLNELIAGLGSFAEARLNTDSAVSTHKQKELSALLCAIYNVLHTNGFERMAALLAKIKIVKAIPSTADSGEATEYHELIEIHAYWSDADESSARDDYGIESYVGSDSSEEADDDRQSADFSDTDSVAEPNLAARHHPPATESPLHRRSASLTTWSASGSLEPPAGLPPTVVPTGYSLFSPITGIAAAQSTSDRATLSVTPLIGTGQRR